LEGRIFGGSILCARSGGCKVKQRLAQFSMPNFEALYTDFGRPRSRQNG